MRDGGNTDRLEPRSVARRPRPPSIASVAYTTGTVTDRFKQFPAALASQVRSIRLAGQVPALIAHPDWKSPAPIVLWMHGRTASKEMDPGRYLRWIRAGIAACAIDLPGHGERLDESMQTPEQSLNLIERGVREVDVVVEALRDLVREHSWPIDLNRMGIGGMSAGGMVTLRRLCDPHGFRCAAVEATTGNLDGLYHPSSGRKWLVEHPAERIAAVDAMQNLGSFSPVPLLALHSEADELVPVAGQARFIAALRGRYGEANAGLIEWVTWPNTGAPQEHIGFGRVSNEAKNLQTAFLKRWLVEAE